MIEYKFNYSLNTLPKEIPLFPLNNVLLLPSCRLPLNLFENRYLHMFDHALKNQRLIGMIQPSEKVKNHTEIKSSSLYSIGCAGKIVAFNQTNDNRYEIVLKGVCRFQVVEEIKSINEFRNAKVSWTNFKQDIEDLDKKLIKNRNDFEDKLKVYLKKIGVNADWEAIEASSDEDLVNSIAMGCPFTNAEKQALLEANDLKVRAEVLISLIDMIINENKSLQSNTFS